MATKTPAKSKTRPPKMKCFEERVIPCKHVFQVGERIELGEKMTAAMQTHSEVEN